MLETRSSNSFLAVASLCVNVSLGPRLHARIPPPNANPFLAVSTATPEPHLSLHFGLTSSFGIIASQHYLSAEFAGASSKGRTPIDLEQSFLGRLGLVCVVRYNVTLLGRAPGRLSVVRRFCGFARVLDSDS